MVLFHAQRATNEEFRIRGWLVFAAIIIYCGIVWWSDSLLVAVCGGVAILAGRSFSGERLFAERLALVTDLLVEMDLRGHDRTADVVTAVDNLRSRRKQP